VEYVGRWGMGVVVTPKGENVSRDIIVVLPVLNEADNIARLVAGIRHVAAGLSRDLYICFIDDGSKDGTVEMIRETMTTSNDVHLIQRTKTSRGSQRGGALKAGIEYGLRHTNCGIFVEMDGDLSHSPVELLAGIELIDQNRCDVAIASKFLPGSVVTNRSVGRRFISYMASISVGTLITRKIKDYSNGYRFYSRAAAELLARHRLKYDTPIYLTEALALWLARGVRVIEFPSAYIGRNEGLSKLRWSDLLNASLASFEIAWRYHIVGFEPSPGAYPTDASPDSARGTVHASLDFPKR
jgi:dolichol-phosphate mannosyltransferase